MNVIIISNFLGDCRYYYDKNTLSKVHGKRYAYKFDFQALLQQTCQQAAGVVEKVDFHSAASYAKFNGFLNPAAAGVGHHPHQHHHHQIGAQFVPAHPAYWPVYINNRYGAAYAAAGNSGT